MINNYLAYLKDISRKIVSDSGFEKALLDKGIKNPSFSFQKTSNVLNLKPNDEYHKLIRNIDAYLNKNNDKKLFCGFGLIAGTKGRIYAAPLIYLECEITKSEHTYNIDFDFTTTSFNYDLLSSILNYSISRRFSVTDDEDFNEDYQNEVEIVEEIENKIKNIDTVQGLESFANEVFIRLQERLKDFKEIEPHSTNYNLKKEILLFNNKRKSSRSDNRERKSIFETELIYVNASHYFVNTIPHQLSTYEALNQLMDETQKNNFQNISLEKLLKNIITDETNKIDHQEVYELDDIIRKYMPLNFSDAQISAIKNAFGSEISYIQGPPGTGKSYTIGAIVLCALFLGKKVLLVSQKEAALDVIKEKIEPF